MALLHFALQPGGYLLLGTSETIGDRENAFETVNAKMRIFKKRVDSIPSIAAAVGAPPSVTRFSNGSGERTPLEISANKKSHEKIWETVSARLMKEFGATCLVLNAKQEILHSFGEPERFLTVHSGQASLNILKLAPRTLSLALSSALRRAVKEQRVIRCSAVPLP